VRLQVQNGQSSAHRKGGTLCNLYSQTKSQQAIRELARAMSDRTGNMPPLAGIFPDYLAPMVRNQPDGSDLTIARWGVPSPVFALQGKKSDPGITNVRNVKSPHWRRWLGIENRCRCHSRTFPRTSTCPTARDRRCGLPWTRRGRLPAARSSLLPEASCVST